MVVFSSASQTVQNTLPHAQHSAPCGQHSLKSIRPLMLHLIMSCLCRAADVGLSKLSTANARSIVYSSVVHSIVYSSVILQH